MLFYIYCLFMFVSQCFCQNDRPIIGILAQDAYDTITEGEDDHYSQFIASSYVKFMESGGARVIPIMINNTDDAYYDNILSSINGVLIPGGGASIKNDSMYGMAGQKIIERVFDINANGVHFPMWTTCLGFEMYFYVVAGFSDFMFLCDTRNIALHVELMEGYENSQLMSSMPEYIFNITTTQNVTFHYHQWCHTPEDFLAHGLDEDYHIISINEDRQGEKFVSVTEHKNYPIYGSMWHPEKNQFEWKLRTSTSEIPHFLDAIHVAQYFSNFFVDEARKNDHSFATVEEEDAALIYNWKPKDLTGVASSYQQVYLFP